MPEINPMNECDCSTAHPGILWPWGNDVPYVERCDLCQVYANDDDAADALVKALLEVGLSPLRGEHVERDPAVWRSPEAWRPGVDTFEAWVAAGRPVRRVGLYVYPSPAAVDNDPARWRVYVDAAQSSLTNLTTN